jgi:uncharacterized membrane protein
MTHEELFDFRAAVFGGVLLGVSVVLLAVAFTAAAGVIGALGTCVLIGAAVPWGRRS